MPRRGRRVPAKSIRDLRAATLADSTSTSSGAVTITPASSTTNDGPELTDADIAPQASPAKKKAAPKKAKA